MNNMQESEYNIDLCVDCGKRPAVTPQGFCGVYADLGFSNLDDDRDNEDE